MNGSLPVIEREGRIQRERGHRPIQGMAGH
jgi:hypothetical protein